MASRVGNTTNLESNSRYDLLVFDFQDGYPVGNISLGFGKTPKRISGVQKVSQVFLKTLLTYTGSDVVTYGRGTSFPEYTGTYNLQSNDNAEVKTLITQAVKRAESQSKSILNVSTEGLSSQLEAASLIGFDQTSEGVTIQIQILTKAGETAPIALPFTSLGIEVNA
jgi:hypothetical protein